MLIKIKDVDYNFKTSFATMTVDDYVNALAVAHLSVIERVSNYTTIPVSVLNELPVKHFNVIAEAVQFVEDYDVLKAICKPLDIISKENFDIPFTDVGLSSFRNIEKAKRLSIEIPIKNIGKIAGVYWGKDLSGEPLLNAWAICDYYLNSVNSFFERFKELNDFQYSEEELEAGVENLDGFGHYPIVFRIANSRGMSNDAVLDMTAIEVYTELLYDYRLNKFKTDLSALKVSRQEHFDKTK